MDRCLPFGIIPKKRLGQNFLVDKKVVADFVAAAELTKSDLVVEVGAGTGVVTEELAKHAGKVFAFEIDRDLIPVQQSILLNYKNVEIVNQDFLKINNLTISRRFAPSDPPTADLKQFNNWQYKIVDSIPYQITSPLIHKLLVLGPKPSLVVLLIQKEVAQKITAKPPKATYLSNIVKLLGEVKIVRFVPKTAFRPVPEVDGAIIKLVPSAKGGFSTYCLVPKTDVEGFQKFLHRGFQNPRQMLRRKFDPEILEKCGIAPTCRAQELTLADWWRLHKFAFGVRLR